MSYQRQLAGISDGGKDILEIYAKSEDAARRALQEQREFWRDEVRSRNCERHFLALAHTQRHTQKGSTKH